jgi:hypothetical protein
MVVVEGVNQQYRGRLLDVTLAGLELEINPGEVLRLTPEEVRRIGLA